MSPLQPMPLDGQYSVPARGWCIGQGPPSQVADGSANYANRQGVYYPGDTVKVQTFGPLTGVTWTVKAMLTSRYGGITLGDTIATGPQDGGGTVITLGSSYLPGAYCCYFHGPNVDAQYGDSYGRVFFIVIRPHANFPTIPVSKWSGTNFDWKPSGRGKTDAEVDANSSNGGSADMILRAACSMGVGRTEIVGSSSPFNMNGGSEQRQTDAVEYATNVVGPYWLNPSNPAWADPVRTRQMWVNYPQFNSTYDSIQVQNTGSEPPYITWLNIYAKTPSVDQTKVFIKIGAGTAGGTTKLQVYYPNGATLAETYDNLTTGTDASTKINTTTPSAYIRAWDGGATTAAASGPTAIGTAVRSQLVTAVASLVPLGCTRFEGPLNEPGLSEETAHQFYLFQGAVTQTAGAKAIGPSPVTITNLAGWATYLDYLNSVGLTKDDYGLGSHDYNTCVNGDINDGRAEIEAFLALIAAKGLAGIELWETEANQSLTMGSPAPVFMASRSRVGLIHTLLWEQYGVPRERNTQWYDLEHGFWSYPSFMVAADQSALPFLALYSVLGQETFGQNHHHRIDFGSVAANRIFLGSVYGTTRGGSTAVMVCTSAMPNSTVTLQVAGTTAALTVVDACGTTTTKTPDGSGRITVDVPEVPTYVRLPAGVSVSVYSVRNWAHNPAPSISAGRNLVTLGGASAPQIANDTWMSYYNGLATPGITISGASLPDTAVVQFASDVALERVIAFTGPCYQSLPALLTYSIATWDGASYTARNIRQPDGSSGATITKSPPASFLFGDTTVGTTRDQLWDEQWIEDIELVGGPITCKGYKITVTATSYGGAVDSAADAIMSGYGASGGAQFIALQELMSISASTLTLPASYYAAQTADSPIIQLPLGDTSGTTAVDLVNTPTLDGTYSGSNYVLGNTGGPLTDGSKYWSLQGGTGKVSIPHDALIDVGDTFTFECWFSTIDAVFDDWDIAGRGTILPFNSEWAFGLLKDTDNHTAKVRLRTSNGANTVITSLTSIPAGGPWSFLAYTKSGATSKLYLNGLDSSNPGTNQTITSTGDGIIIGGGGYLNVLGVGFYSTALSATRILAHYNAGLAPHFPVSVTAPTIEGA